MQNQSATEQKNLQDHVFSDHTALSMYNDSLLSLASQVKKEAVFMENAAYRKKKTQLCGSVMDVYAVVRNDKIVKVSLGADSCVLGKASAYHCQEWLYDKNLQDVLMYKKILKKYFGYSRRNA